MAITAKTRLYKLSGDKYAIYLPRELVNDSQFPFKLEEARQKDSIEIVIMPSKIEGLGKLLVRPFKGGEKKR